MKISKKSSRSKYLVLAGITLILAAASVAIGISLLKPSQNKDTQHTKNTTDDTSNTHRQRSANQPTSQTDVENKQSFLDSETKESKTEHSPAQQSVEPSLDARLESNNTVVVTTNLSSIPSGECTLTVTGDDKSITQKAQVIYTPEYSTCAGFSIDRSSIPSDYWTIKLSVNSINGTSSKTINYKIQ